jgi:hypothetical protein
VQRELGSLTPEIADEIWRRLKPVLGEQQRPRAAGEPPPGRADTGGS